MNDYNVEGRLITKDDWEYWLKLREEYSRKSISKTTENNRKGELYDIFRSKRNS